ncbi:MAG: methyltransferase domain-containing protein [Acidimicrobiia bacterium]|nr:methyltransferase domain-containing protein [Acidimicrobiia bacterium]MDQ3500066.1 class I SAM-dependent methyltransferase [Actinomycetota bacterium]
MTCPLCGGSSIWEFFEMNGVPTQDGKIWPTKDEALHSPVGDIQLVFCRNCTYIWNSVHDPAKVDFVGYEFSLEHSARFRAFTEELAKRLIEGYDVRRKTVIDVGCGKGQFLRKLVQIGDNRGIGFDPSYAPPPGGEIPDLVGYRDYYQDRYTDLSADLFVCRHVIDILGDPALLPQLMRRAMNGKSVAYIEVPDGVYTFGSRLIWNVVYEHKSWFTQPALAFLLQKCGYRVLRLEHCWNDEYLGIDVAPDETNPTFPPPSEAQAVESTLLRFVESVNETVRDWQGRFARLRDSDQTMAIWGAGARAITLLNLCDPGDSLVKVIDVNPGRQGLFLPRTVQEIVAPESLGNNWPEVVLISNPTYAPEIEAQARELGFKGEFWSL